MREEAARTTARIGALAMDAVRAAMYPARLAYLFLYERATHARAARKRAGADWKRAFDRARQSI